MDRLEAAGRTVVLAGWDGRARGALAVADTLKAGAPAALAELAAMGLELVMLTGDNASTARSVAASAGISRVRAEVLPDGKADEIRRLQQEGRVVAMVGDGVNDAPALVQADLGIALGTGTDVAIESADVTLLSADLDGVATAIRLARRTYLTILQNLGWAFGYNAAAIPLAALGLLNPVVAGAAMGLLERVGGRQQPAAAPLRAGREGDPAGLPAARCGPDVGPPPAAHGGADGAGRRSVALAWMAPVVLLALAVGVTRWAEAPGPTIDRTVYLDLPAAAAAAPVGAAGAGGGAGNPPGVPGPDRIVVGRGERVRLVFVNPGAAPMGAVIGLPPGAGGPAGAPHLEVGPGSVRSLTRVFARPGDVAVGWYRSGPDRVGPLATLVVEAARPAGGA